MISMNGELKRVIVGSARMFGWIDSVADEPNFELKISGINAGF
jgi:hypothetical protein